MSAAGLTTSLVLAAVLSLPSIAHSRSIIWPNELTLLQARVAAACLTNFTAVAASREKPEGAGGAGDQPLLRCRRNIECAACWNASLWDPREAADCQRLCSKKSLGCLGSCRQLSTLYRQLMELPQPPRRTKSLPPFPIVSVRNGQLFFDGVTWPKPGEASQLLLAVQARFDYVGSIKAESGSWRNLSLLTGGPGPVRLEEPRPGHRYQFRAATVSPEGSRGFGEPSEPLTLLPLDSAAAVRLSGGPASYDESAGWASVPVWWSQIADGSGGTAHRFQVSWTKASAGIDESNPNSAVKISQSLPGTERSYRIEHLEPDSLYHVEVRSLTASGLGGPPSRISVSTARQLPAAWRQRSAVGAGGDGDGVGDCPTEDESKRSAVPRTSFAVSADNEGGVGERLRPVVVATVGLAAVDGSGIFLLEWRRRVCIGARAAAAAGVRGRALISGAILATARELRISAVRFGGLEFNCRYWARLSPLSDRHQRPPSQKTSTVEWCFATPADCGGQPECGPGSGDSDTAPPAAPVGLAVQSLGASTQNEAGPGCLVTWRQPTGLGAPSAYRIVWGPRLDESVAPDAYSYDSYHGGWLQPRIDPEKARTRVVDKEVTSLTIRPLSRATLYIVKVRSLAFHANGSGGRLLASRDVEQLCATVGFIPRLQSSDSAAVLQQQQHRMAFSGDFSQFLAAGQSPVQQPASESSQCRMLFLCAVTLLALLQSDTIDIIL